MKAKITKTKTFKGCIGLNNVGLDHFDKSINDFCENREITDIKFVVNNDNLFAMVFYKEVVDL